MTSIFDPLFCSPPEDIILHNFNLIRVDCTFVTGGQHCFIYTNDLSQYRDISSHFTPMITNLIQC